MDPLLFAAVMAGVICVSLIVLLFVVQPRLSTTEHDRSKTYRVVMTADAAALPNLARFKLPVERSSPVLDTQTPFVGKLCTHEVDWMAHYGHTTANPLYNFEVTRLDG